MNILHKEAKSTPRDFFMYLGVIGTLYISVASIIALWFRIIDSWFADPLKYIDPYSTGISLAIAALIVIFPVFIGISWMIHKDEKKNEEKKEIGVRKWLIFLTLFIAGLTILIDLIVLLNTFLSGEEITGSFLAKVFVILVVIGGVFAYYFYKLRTDISDKLAKYLTWGTIILVIGSIVLGFIVMGSPQSQRMKRLDADRVADLQNIQWQIVNYWQQKEALPDTLSDLEDPLSGFRVPTDPETGEAYTYTKTARLSFELCATFKTVLEESKASSVELYGFDNSNWAHPIGEHCFDRTVDPELYPPVSKLR